MRRVRRQREKSQVIAKSEVAQVDSEIEDYLELLRRLDNERKSILSNTESKKYAIIVLVIILAAIVAGNVLLAQHLELVIQASVMLSIVGLLGIMRFTKLTEAAIKNITTLKASLKECLPQRAETEAKLSVFAVKSISRSNIDLGTKFLVVDGALIDSINELGVFPLEDYEELGIAFIDESGQFDFSSSELENLHWVRLKRRCGLPNAQVEKALSSLARG